MKTFPLSAKNRRMMYLNNADANTLTAEWTLAKGTNFPSYSGVNFWYIHTFAYALASDNPEVISEGRQIAYSYQSANVIFQRSCESGTWTAWTQVPTHAEIEAINNIILKGSIESNSSQTLEPILQNGCHTLTLKRSDDYVSVCYDWWSSEYKIISGSIPTGITITKNSSSHNVTVASTRSTAISFELT